MTITITKSLLALGVAGGVAGAGTAIVMLMPSTIAQTLESEGYKLISQIDKSKQDAIFEARRSEYSNPANNDKTFAPKENHTNISLKDFKNLCSKYENSNDGSFKDRVAKWCTLNIEDYLTKVEGRTYNNKASGDSSWGAKYNSSDKAKVRDLIGLTTSDESGAGSKLHAWCGKVKTENYSKKNKETFENAKLLCLE